MGFVMSNEELTGLWKCPNCGESIEADFDLCWNCGTTRKGELTPDFQSEAEKEISSEVRAVVNRQTLPIVVCAASWLTLFFCYLFEIGVKKIVGSAYNEYEYSVIGSIILTIAISSTVAIVISFLFIYKEYGHTSKTDVHLKHKNEKPVCPHCMTPNEPQNHFCVKCATPLTSHATIDPLGRIQAMGDTYRKAANKPANRVVLIGMWLIFGPQIPYLIYSFHRLYAGSDRYPWHSIEVNETYTNFISVLIAFVLLIIYSAILYKVTKNYYKNKRAGFYLENSNKVKVVGNEHIVENGKVPEHFDARRFWKCPNCGEILEVQFTECWNCRAKRVDK
jgi:hypothetical protein